MQHALSTWPEVIFLDGTYKLLMLDLVLMLLVVEDSSGQSHVVGGALLVHEDRETFTWFLDVFKQVNLEACEKIQMFMCDKDLLQRDIIKETFPGVPVLICRFHVLQIFAREVPGRTKSLTKAQKDRILEVLQRLVYSSSPQEYEANYKTFSEIAPPELKSYYDENWDNVKDEWVKYLMAKGNLMNFTNNRTEAINKWLKNIMHKFQTLVAFFENFFKWNNTHESQIAVKSSVNFIKRPVAAFKPEQDEYKYQKVLTAFAWSRFLLPQIRAKTGELTIFDAENLLCKIKSSEGLLDVSEKHCSCYHFNSCHLPCRHIFAVRRAFKLPLFDEKLILQRWRKDYELGAYSKETGESL